MRIEFLLLWYPDLLPREICISIVSISRRRSEGEYYICKPLCKQYVAARARNFQTFLGRLWLSH